MIPSCLLYKALFFSVGLSFLGLHSVYGMYNTFINIGLIFFE